jgi:hypothetical protein
MQALILMALLYALWVLLPIVPASFIYWLFPKDKINVGGPLIGKLTFSASGAFAAYVIVFCLTYPIIEKTLNSLASLMNPSWTVTARVKLLDETGKTVDNPQWLDGLVVQLHPDFYFTTAELVTVSIPELKNSLPNILLSIPRFGSRVIDWESVESERDEFRKIIHITKPIEIHKISTIQASASTQ